MRVVDAEGGGREQVWPLPVGKANLLKLLPAWNQLELWNRLRSEFLGLGPDPLDRTGTRITCG
ncbi:hypothetical protein A5649_08220 [Mycolicibacter heraklionensis]|uniref:Uncharacterized protein n=1 Tax=Mycolicibacter heraklionensis TaxID=512402 RepID=A0AA91EXR3_9MYCO|nr:hypothetical protein [Mycolicibacter heraklionensis]OBK82753.1 hypothetical protein A5649_08220 [Mycolicibacter heraklionensis]